MKITLTAAEVSACKTAIQDAKRGEMCKIIKIEHILTGQTEHIISPDVTHGGWATSSGARSFHGSCTDGSWRKTGLGTHYLINATDTDDGGMILEFTDDLNPELP